MNLGERPIAQPLGVERRQRGEQAIGPRAEGAAEADADAARGGILHDEDGLTHPLNRGDEAISGKNRGSVAWGPGAESRESSGGHPFTGGCGRDGCDDRSLTLNGQEVHMTPPRAGRSRDFIES